MTVPNQKPEKPALFWSGGKDALLALRYWQKAGNPDPLMVTTYDDESGMVPFQEIPIRNIYRQSLHLELPLFTIPVSYPASNIEYLKALKKAFKEAPFQVKDAVFGDLHLLDIREWREKQFAEMGIRTHFPIWGKSPDELLDLLEHERTKIRVRSVSEGFKDFIKPDDLFNREFIETLPDQIDPFGEKGEFHTEVVF